MKRLLTLGTVVVLILISYGLLTAQSNPALGTWKLNVAKSKYVGTPAPKSNTTTITAQGDGVKVSVEGVAGDGSRIAYSYMTNLDGKDSAISGVGAPGGEDTIAVKRVDANTTTSTAKKAGKVTATTRTVISKDGKVRTVTAKGTDDQGKPLSVAAVYDKQ